MTYIYILYRRAICSLWTICPCFSSIGCILQGRRRPGYIEKPQFPRPYFFEMLPTLHFCLTLLTAYSKPCQERRPGYLGRSQFPRQAKYPCPYTLAITPPYIPLLLDIQAWIFRQTSVPNAGQYSNKTVVLGMGLRYQQLFI